MSVLFIVVPLAMVIVGAAVAAYIWAARSGQLDDLETPALRMLHDHGTGARAPSPASSKLPGGRDDVVGVGGRNGAS